MARKRKDVQIDGEGSDEKAIERIPFGRNVQWVSANPSAADKAWLLDNRDDSLAYVGEFLTEIPPSFALSVKFDDNARRYNAVLLCSDKNHPAANCALSLRARTAFDAVYGLAYWVGERSLEPWWSGLEDSSDDPWG